MKLVESSLRWLGEHKDGLDVIFKLAAGAAGGFGLWWTVSTWFDQRERELLKPIVEQHIKTTDAVFEVVGRMAAERDPSKAKTLSSEFWRLYYGPAAVYFSTETYASMQWVAAYVSQCVDGNPPVKGGVSCSLLLTSINAVATDARIDISTRLVEDGLSGMANIHPGIPRDMQQ